MQTRNKIRGERGPGRMRASDVLQVPQEEEGFKVEELVRPEDVVWLRRLTRELVNRGRLYNAAEILSGLAIAHGNIPQGFGVPTVPIAEYINENGFEADEVLTKYIITFPESRDQLAHQVEALWQRITRGKIPVMLGPKEFVQVSIVAPNNQADLRLDQTALDTETEYVLQEAAQPKNILRFTSKLFDVLMVDPEFKYRIPNLEGVRNMLRQEILLLRNQKTDEAWKNISTILKALAVLSADESGIDSEGKIFTRFKPRHLPPTPPLPERKVF